MLCLCFSAHSNAVRPVPIGPEYIGMLVDGEVIDSTGQLHSVDRYINKITPIHCSSEFEIGSHQQMEPDSTSEHTYDEEAQKNSCDTFFIEAGGGSVSDDQNCEITSNQSNNDQLETNMDEQASNLTVGSSVEPPRQLRKRRNANTNSQKAKRKPQTTKLVINDDMPPDQPKLEGIICPIVGCDRIIKHDSNKSRHIKQFHGEMHNGKWVLKRYLCGVCIKNGKRKIAKRKENLLSHFRKEHPDIEYSVVSNNTILNGPPVYKNED